MMRAENYSMLEAAELLGRSVAQLRPFIVRGLLETYTPHVNADRRVTQVALAEFAINFGIILREPDGRKANTAQGNPVSLSSAGWSRSQPKSVSGAAMVQRRSPRWRDPKCDVSQW